MSLDPSTGSGRATASGPHRLDDLGDAVPEERPYRAPDWRPRLIALDIDGTIYPGGHGKGGATGAPFSFSGFCS